MAFLSGETKMARPIQVLVLAPILAQIKIKWLLVVEEWFCQLQRAKEGL